ncbi:protein translocase subunit yajC [Keratinibaculum paraultunense]|uniref:Protein translocase subunit yajC n=1 Tax=Keratinibaculum paraultunense TaxID=1278232 RepID=A0A4R3KWN8_9FIRM|nr:preprotein translocase subunit YajC [Keratinibaculum paraultunense]QQY78762.1 preprotein translocase subunit YajC [Keratinibaculum paraultunense]TCS89556.1 protein translocase subunit yajC [Keratinibaculum paraultunense]
MAAANTGGASLGGLILPIAILVFFYLLVIRPQKKREKQIREMRDNLKVGDQIVTIGGILGKIIKIKDDMVTIEVGSNKTKLDLTKWAVGSVLNKSESKDEENEKDKKEEE